MNVSPVVPLTSVLNCVHVHVLSTSLRLKPFNLRGRKSFSIVGIETATHGSSRSSGPFSSWNGTGHCPSLSSSPGCTGASGQGDTGSRSSKSGPCSFSWCSNLPQPHLNMEEYWNQLAGFLQVPRTRLELEDTAALSHMLQARQAAVHSSVDPVAIRASVVRVSPHNIYQHCLALGEICQHFGLHVESWMYSHVEIVNDPGIVDDLKCGTCLSSLWAACWAQETSLSSNGCFQSGCSAMG